MKIIELKVEDVKLLKTVKIPTNEKLVQLTGRNEEGKTSV